MTAWHVEAVEPNGLVMPPAQVRQAGALMRQLGGRAPFLWEYLVRREIRVDPGVLT
jgi:hypothetical protein